MLIINLNRRLLYYVFAEDFSIGKFKAKTQGLAFWAVKPVKYVHEPSQSGNFINCIIFAIGKNRLTTFSYQAADFGELCCVLLLAGRKNTSPLQYLLKNNFESSSLCVYTLKSTETIAESRVIQPKYQAKLSQLFLFTAFSFLLLRRSMWQLDASPRI